MATIYGKRSEESESLLLIHHFSVALAVRSSDILRFLIRCCFGFGFRCLETKKKKFFRGLSNPRMRFKDFSLCELLNVSIKKKKKKTQLKAKETHIQVNDFGFTVLLKKRNYTRFTRKLRGCKIRANLQSTLLSLAVGIPRFVG